VNSTSSKRKRKSINVDDDELSERTAQRLSYTPEEHVRLVMTFLFKTFSLDINYVNIISLVCERDGLASLSTTCPLCERVMVWCPDQLPFQMNRFIFCHMNRFTVVCYIYKPMPSLFLIPSR
jgi:hypothetical protein